MSAGSFLKGLAGHVVSGVESIQEFLGSEMARTAVITDLGGVPGPGAKDPPVFPTARLDAIKTYRDSVDPDKAADAAVLTDIAAVFDAIAGIVEVWGFTGAEADEVGHALLQLTASTYVRLRWPRLFLVLQAVTALEEKTSTYGAGSNSVVRLGSAAKALTWRMSSLPESSAGCDLPANTSCTLIPSAATMSRSSTPARTIFPKRVFLISR